MSDNCLLVPSKAKKQLHTNLQLEEETMEGSATDGISGMEMETTDAEPTLTQEAIIGISIGSVLGLALVLCCFVVVVVLVRRHRRRRGKMVVSIPGEYEYKGTRGPEGITNAMYAGKSGHWLSMDWKFS